MSTHSTTPPVPAAPCAKYEPMVNQKCKELVKNLTQQVELLTKTTQSIEGILVEQKEKKTSSHEIKDYLELIKEVKEKNMEECYKHIKKLEEEEKEKKKLEKRKNRKRKCSSVASGKKPGKRPRMRIEAPFREKNPEEDETAYNKELEDWFRKEVERFFTNGLRCRNSVLRAVVILKRSSPTPLPFLSPGKQDKWINSRLKHLYE